MRNKIFGKKRKRKQNNRGFIPSIMTQVLYHLSVYRARADNQNQFFQVLIPGVGLGAREVDVQVVNFTTSHFVDGNNPVQLGSNSIGLKIVGVRNIWEARRNMPGNMVSLSTFNITPFNNGHYLSSSFRNSQWYKFNDRPFDNVLEFQICKGSGESLLNHPDEVCLTLCFRFSM